MPRDARDHQLPGLAWGELEPLWVTGLALIIIIPAFEWGSAIIQFFGRGGQRETVEWAVYLSVLVAFPVAAMLVARLIPMVFGDAVATVVKAILVVFLFAEAFFYMVSSAHWAAIIPAVGLAVMTVVVTTPGGVDQGASGSRLVARRGVLTFVALCAWMGCGALESWSGATAWFTSDLWRLAGFALVFALTLIAFRSERGDGSDYPGATARSSRVSSTRIVEWIGVAALIFLSFRTNPVLELYHWEAYAGPVQELRQGGWLLWDSPAQYGLLSILLPTLLPGNAWQSFYVFQAICNLVVALLMLWILRGVRPSLARSALAVLVTAATIFFRPRTATLILAGQMTPSGGPPRFLWSFVMLAMIFVYYRRKMSSDVEPTRQNDRFVLWGTVIWLAAILWSAEAAIYCSAIWFPAFAIYLLQGAVRDRKQGIDKGAILGWVFRSILTPVAALAVVVVGVAAFYRVGLGHFPDWMGYVEYALLYGGGFRALPIDPSGSVWLLLVVFFALSTALVMYLCADATRPALMVLAAAWGGVWAISSYFVSRSHPVNLLSIAAFVVFAGGVCLNVLRIEHREPWHDLIRVAMVPVFAMPIALTLTHPGFVQQITAPQLSYDRFTEQIPLMEPSLNELLVQAGAKPSDPVVRIGDGRLMLPAWRPSRAGGPRVVSPYSWLPKQYELIGTLPASRRRKYIDRAAEHLRLSGWLVHSKRDGIPDFAQQLSDISRTHVETKRFENSDWIVAWYQLKPSAAR